MQVEHRLPRQHIPPALQGKSLNSANLYGLKQVLHAHARASEAGRKFNAYLFETRRPEANHRISREAEALSWDSDQRIELLVGVFVVKDGQGIATGGHPSELDSSNVRRNRLLERVGICLAVREVRRVSGHAQANGSVRVTKRRQIDFDRSGRSSRRNQRNSDQKRGKSCHSSIAYQRPEDFAKRVMK